MPLPVHITDHAVARWIERIDPLATPDEVRGHIRCHERAIRVAATFGAPVVRLATGAKLVVCANDDDIAVVTVLGRRQLCRQLMPR